jgi:hypothetical protein
VPAPLFLTENVESASFLEFGQPSPFRHVAWRRKWAGFHSRRNIADTSAVARWGGCTADFNRRYHLRCRPAPYRMAGGLEPVDIRSHPQS